MPDVTPPTPGEVEEMRARHKRWPGRETHCFDDGQRWPCDADRLLALVNNQALTLHEDRRYIDDLDACLDAVHEVVGELEAANRYGLRIGYPLSRDQHEHDLTRIRRAATGDASRARGDSGTAIRERETPRSDRAAIAAEALSDYAPYLEDVTRDAGGTMAEQDEGEKDRTVAALRARAGQLLTRAGGDSVGGDQTLVCVQVLAAHTGWSQTGPDVHGLMEVECFSCGVRLGDDRHLIAAWEARTGRTHNEWATRGAAPAFDDALAQHQTDMLNAAGLLRPSHIAEAADT